MTYGTIDSQLGNLVTIDMLIVLAEKQAETAMSK
jgi:hypothetical protein